MRRKTIKNVLRKKFNEFLESITDEHVKDLVKENSIITGGAITSLLLNEKPKDYDIYFTNKKTVKAVAEYYTKKWNSMHQENSLGIKGDSWVLDGSDVQSWKDGRLGITKFVPGWDKGDIDWNSIEEQRHLQVPVMIYNTEPERIKVMISSKGVAYDPPNESVAEILENADDVERGLIGRLDKNDESKEKYRPIFLSTNAITLSDGVQLVIRFYGNAREIHKNFDFVHATCYWTSKNVVELPAQALEMTLNKELHYNGSKYPVCSIFRTRKFINRGWSINAGQILKMCYQISALDLNDIGILEDQLIGVDSHYFVEIINTLRKQQEKDPNFTINRGTLESLIDNMF